MGVSGLIAGLVDTIAGGGGIITLPVLLAIGLPPHFALGTNKLQSSFGSLTATLRFRSAGLINFRDLIPGIAATLVGALIGAWAVNRLDTRLLKLFIPILLVAIFLFMLFKPEFGAQSRPSRWPRHVVWLLGGLVLGFYDGFLGPGTGTFWAMALIALAGMDLRQATAHTKAVNFTSNIVSLAVFLWSGAVILSIGLLMGLCQFAGAWIASHLVIKRGTAMVRILVMTMSSLMIIYLLLRYFLNF